MEEGPSRVTRIPGSGVGLAIRKARLRPMMTPMSIHTARLDLIPATVEILRAELRGPLELQALLGAEVPGTWPPDLYDADAIHFTIARLEEQVEPTSWWFHYFIRKATPTSPAVVIGAGGYKGPPQAGTVEVGYSVLPEHRRQGYASEATRGLVAHAFAHPEVTRVIAHTLPELAPSIGVLEKCNFRFIGEGTEEGAICFELMRTEWMSSA